MTILNAAVLPPDDPRWEALLERLELETGMDLRERARGRFWDAARATLPRHGIMSGADLDRALAHAASGTRLIEDLSSALTVGETFFFRNETHFRALREEVVPDILRANEPLRQIRIWCAGCATGEEPYSLSILLDSVLESRPDWSLHLLATDLNPDFLERARAARYRPWSFRGTGIHSDARYFVPEKDEYRLVARVRDRVRFRYLNLVKDLYPSPVNGTLALDLIVFRNVALYLKAPVVASILHRMRQALRPGGWILLGESELPQTPPPGFEARRFGDATFFRRAEGDEAESDPGPPPLLSDLIPAGTILPSPRPLPVWVPLPEPRARPAEEDTPAWDRLEALLQRRAFEQAERLLAGLAGPKARAALRLRYARSLLFAGEARRAERMAELCCEEDPLFLEAYLLKGGLLEDAGDLAGAELAYRRALYVDRGCVIAHFRLALVLQQRGGPGDAPRSFQTLARLIRKSDPHQRVEYGDGLCYGRLQELVSILSGGAA